VFLQCALGPGESKGGIDFTIVIYIYICAGRDNTDQTLGPRRDHTLAGISEVDIWGKTRVQSGNRKFCSVTAYSSKKAERCPSRGWKLCLTISCERSAYESLLAKGVCSCLVSLSEPGSMMDGGRVLNKVPMKT
jgi:hypothetical protein